uniref:Uncharacterized protein n=1 Tax=Oryza rufipogon TaxID=4529 RepID=A0A0E0QBR8_ORYRU
MPSPAVTPTAPLHHANPPPLLVVAPPSSLNRRPHLQHPHLSDVVDPSPYPCLHPARVLVPSSPSKSKPALTGT